MNSLRKLANGELKVQTLPGSDRKSTIPKSKCDSFLPQAGRDYVGDDGRNYVNIDNEYGEEDKEYNQSSLSAMFSSNMSCVESLTYASSVADLKDLDRDEIRLFENYKFKDKSDISNSLLIARSRDKIVQAINSNCVLLITGATGCGKSTQVPQYILDDCMSRKKYCNIIVTQPRRIAAISVSKQVNKERGWKSGLLVGYQVGRKKDVNPSTTKIVYCTAGILLQKIIKAKSLSEYTHIILDEVHERTLEMDFLLLVIKKLIRSLSSNSQSTRIILMSATANPYKLQEYFSSYYSQYYNRLEGATLINVDGNSNYSITKHYLDDLYDVIPAARRMEFTKPQIDEAGYLTAIELVKAFDSMEIKGVIKKNSSVLIFLPGIFEIEEMHRQMESEMDKYNYKWTLVPLHSSITSEEQERVFEIPPLHYRKIILSTNIAESSITVSDISYVIDFCLMKQLKNEMRSNYSMLIMEWASKSNCKQRAGRVGRVSEGRVYRLVPLIMFEKQFNDHEVPEMNRCSLSRVVLMSKLLDMGTPKQLLATAMDPPSFKNIALTILTLKQVGALLPTVNGVISSMDGDLTFLGKVMAHLPLEPPMAKLIYFGHIFNILSEAIIMACGLSMKSLFSQPFNKRLDAYTQKLSWANNSCSDPIAYINAFQSWLEKKPEFDRNRNLEKSWAYNNFIQLSAIRELYDLVDDVTDRLRRSFGIVVNSGAMKWNKSEEKAMACKVILGGAFYPNYFIRGASNAYVDEHHVLKLLDDHDPYRSVYFVGFPKDQPSMLYKEAVENMFPEKFAGKPTAFFCKSSNKVYVEFPTSNINNAVHNNLQGNGNQLIPGNICFGVYVAMKMYQLKYDFKIPLLQPEDAKHKIEICKKMAAKKNVPDSNISPFQKSILEEIETNIKNITITISYFESIDCFWAQLNDKTNKVKMLEIWQTANGIVNLVNAKPSDIKDGKVYIVNYEEDKYRAILTIVPPRHQVKYKFFLIDFGQVVELTLENVFNISNLNDDVKSLVNVPALSFKCKFAKIQPILHGNLENNWSVEANNFVRFNGMWPKSLEGTIYSIVNDVVSFEDLKFTTNSNNDPISIKEYLIKNKLANHSDETFASKMDHNKRSNTHKTAYKWNQSNDLCLNLKSPTIYEAYQMLHLKGPHSPLEMSVHGINHNCVSKLVKIESQSVNSVLLDSCPNDYHERLFVAGNVCMNESDKLTLWDSTMMPNIPGMSTIICLLFSPCVEIRYNDSFTKMIGAICGLGYEESSRPLFKDNDIEITFDTIVDDDLLSKINIIRMLLNKCVNPNDPEGPGDIFDITLYLQQSLLELLSIPSKFKSPEPYSNKYMWARIPKSRLRSPYKEEGSPIMHPMAGSDVYKLIWNAKLSSKLTLNDCKELYFKLDKIRRLKDGFSMANFSSEMNLENLSCPLCYLTFDNKTSMEMHFKNYQHIERYQLARSELFVSYKGPVSDIQNL